MVREGRGTGVCQALTGRLDPAQSTPDGLLTHRHSHAASGAPEEVGGGSTRTAVGKAS